MHFLRNASATADNLTPNALLESVIAALFSLDQPDQTGGRSPDFVCRETGATYELKVDKWAIRQCSTTMFAEFATSTDGGKTLRASGIASQYAFCDAFLILRATTLRDAHEILVVPSEKMAGLLDGPWPERVTKTGANGNAPGRYSYGKLVAFARIAELATATWALPAGFNPLDPVYAPMPLSPAVRGVA